MSLLMTNSLTVVAKVFSDTLIFLLQKYESILQCESYSHFLAKNINVFAIFQNRNFYITLGNKFVKFCTAGPWSLPVADIESWLYFFCYFFQKIECLTLSLLDKYFSRLHFETFFSYFPRKLGPFFYASFLFRRQFVLNFKPYFLGNEKKDYILVVNLPRKHWTLYSSPERWFEWDGSFPQNIGYNILC